MHHAATTGTENIHYIQATKVVRCILTGAWDAKMKCLVSTNNAQEVIA